MSNRISSKSKSSNKVKSDSYSGLKTKSNSSEASKKPSTKTSSNVKLKSETTEPSKVVKSSSSLSRSSSKNTSKKDSKDLTLKKSNSSTVAVKNSVNATKSNSPLRSEKIKESSSSHKSNSKSRNEKHERASRSSLQKNDGNKTEQEQLKKSRSKEQSNEHSRKGESNEHSRKGESNEHSRKGESNEHSRKGQSKEHSRKGESNEHSRKGQSNEHSRKGQSNERIRKEQSIENSRKGRANENKKGESNEQRKKGHSKEHNKKQQVYEQGKKDQSYESTRKDQVNKNNAEEQDQSSHKTSRPNETKKSDSRSKDGKKKSSKHSSSSKPPDIQNMQKLPENKEHNDTEAEARLNNIEAAKISTKITKPPKKPVTESKIQQQNDDTDIAEVIDFKDVPLENDKKQTSDETVPHVDPSHNSLDTLESGISMTSPHDLSDGEVEESFSSRVVEVDEMDLNEEDPSPPSSSNQYLRSSSSRLRLDYPEEKKEFGEEVNEQEDIDYEEDFEDYESDFDDDDEEEDEDESEEEELSMTDDDEESKEENERIVENGEDHDAEPDPQMKAILSAIKAENNRPKFIPNQNKNREDNPSTEGGAQPIDSSLHKPNRPKTSKAYVNFARAKEKAKSNKASQKLKNRGQLLQEMIQLDSVFIDLFSQAPESYETYIAAFGSSNSTQVSVQTNEDALTEAVQTDPVNILEKWTQNPIHIPVNGESLPTPEDYLGVGGESSSGDGGDSFAAYNAAISSDSGRLSKFLAASSQVVLMLLEEKTLENEDLSLNGSEDESLGFSKSGIALGLGLVSLLEGRPCNLVAFCPSDSSLLLTGHGAIDLNNNEAPATSAIEEASREDCEGEKEEAEETLEWLRSANGSLLCLWSVRQPSFPSRIFTCRSPPLVATFNPGRPRVVISGLNDGSLAAWDLRESSAHHPLSIVIAGSKWKLSPPSYITACGPENIIEGSAIVALETVKREEEEWDISNFSSFQVVSLSCSGQLTWWVLVQGEIQPIKTLDVDNPGISSELGAAPWSRITLSRAASISISQVLQSEDTLSGASLCYDLKLSGNDPNQLYVATANGNIVNCSRHNIKMHPSFFTPELEPGTTAVSISVCPHDPRYFLVGGADGLIRLHCSMSALPLTCWQASTNPAAIKRVEWSPSRPCVFYMLDVLGMLHIWDLSAGDIYPIISVNEGGLIGGRLTSFNIARPTHNDNKMLFAAFASDTGALNIRSISSRFLRSNEENYKSELERFECYVNII